MVDRKSEQDHVVKAAPIADSTEKLHTQSPSKH